jgi:spermidine synthase
VARATAIAVLFFGSGAVGLCFEGLWFAQAGLAFGNGVWASSLVLAGFMAGMALGYLWAAKYAERFRNPLRAYAALEVIVALSGVALVYGLPAIGRALAPLASTLLSSAPLRAIHFCLGFALLVLPSFAMGTTLPLLTRAAASSGQSFGRVLGLLYGANTLGAMFGVLAAQVLLVERFGIRGSALLAGAVGLAIAGAAFALSRSADVELRASADPVRSLLPPRAAVPWLVSGGFAGFALLGLEVVWFRFLLLFLNETPLAFAVVLAIVLAGIGLGSLLAAGFAQRTQFAPELSALVGYAAGALGVAGYCAYPLFLEGRLEPNQGVLTVLRLAAPLVLPTSFASGVLFPLLGAGLRRALGSDADAAGHLGFVNTVGAALGSLVAAFVLLPKLGMERSLLCLFALYAVVGACIPLTRTRVWLWRGVPLLVIGACMLFFPHGLVRSQYVRISVAKWFVPGSAVADVREGLTATVVHVVHRHAGVPLADQLVTNSYSMTSNGFLGRRYMELFVYLPVAVHPRVERALVVGYGMGNTAAALTRTREVQRIDIVDISTDMLALSRELQSQREPSPLDDPRVRVHIEDGRFYLQARSARYDLITGEPPPPIMAGVVNLYTAEYFGLVRERLREGGIASYWLPMMNISAPTAKSIIRGFCDAFEDCSLWHGSARNFMLFGTRGQREPVSEARFTAQWRDPAVRGRLALAGFEFPTQLPALFIGDAAYLRALTEDAPPLTDDWPARMHQPGKPEDHVAMIDDFRDIGRARERFVLSPAVARLVPAPLRERSLSAFETQSLLDALSYPDAIQLRNSRLLHEVLRKTELRTPVLLLLGSAPEHEAALARLSEMQAEAPAWLLHRAASRLAERDLPGALDLLRRVPEEQLPMPDLTEYVEYAVRRSEQVD